MPSKVFSRTGASRPSSLDLERGAPQGGRREPRVPASRGLVAGALPEESLLTHPF